MDKVGDDSRWRFGRPASYSNSNVIATFKAPFADRARQGTKQFGQAINKKGSFLPWVFLDISQSTLAFLHINRDTRNLKVK